MLLRPMALQTKADMAAANLSGRATYSQHISYMRRKWVCANRRWYTSTSTQQSTLGLLREEPDILICTVINATPGWHACLLDVSTHS